VRAQSASPDLGAAAREAVVAFLRDASAAAEAGQPAQAAEAPPAGSPAEAPPVGPPSGVAGQADQGGTGVTTLAAAVPEPATPVESAEGGLGPPPSAGRLSAEDIAVRAAATSIATLDRIEAAAAKLEADIAAALAEQTRLQAGAGEAAEKAVRAAQEAWTSAGTAEEASKEAAASAAVVGKWVAVGAALLVVQLLILLLFAASSH